MIKILHIIKKSDDFLAYDMISRQRRNKENEVAVLLLHDAVYTPPNEDTTTFCCRDDLEARNVTCHGNPVDYKEIVNLMLDADKVINW